MTSAVPKVGSKIADAKAQSEAHAPFRPIRREVRVDAIRSAEYSPFPRIRSNQMPRRGFTRNVSPLGMCLGVDVPEQIGALLRIEVRELDGQSIGATIGRVVWCKPTRDGRYWIGLDLLCEPDGVCSKWHQRILEEQD
jgi:hypothetical protein